MNTILTPIEVRVLGSLIEKEITTPDYYPLTLNALTLACNQKSNRNPVMNLEEKDVLRALDALREKHLVIQKDMAGSRVLKYAHKIRDAFVLSPQELGILCVLFLRGPQTSGDIHVHTNRLYEFKSLEEIEAVFQQMITREDGPFIRQLPRKPGHRESRYAHLFSGEIKDEESLSTVTSETVVPIVHMEDQRIVELEQQVSILKLEMAELKEKFAEFIRQFE